VRLLAALLAATLLLVAPAAAAAPSKPRLLVVGDSTAYDTVPPLAAELSGWQVEPLIHFAEGVEVAPAALRAFKGPLPKVIHVGFSGELSEVEKLRAAVDEVMRIAGGQRCVVWTNVWRAGAPGAGFEALNAALAEAARRHPNLLLIDWAGMVAANPHWADWDGVHVAPEGNRARALAVAREARRCAWRPGGRQRVPRRVLVLGDSLAWDNRPHLARALPRWRIENEVWFARKAVEGPAVLRTRRPLPRVIHVSLGSADDPERVRAFRQAVARTMRIAGPRRCVVWANVWRPVPDGPGFEAINAVLADEAAARPNLLVVDWNSLVAANQHWLVPDHVHVYADGNRARAAAVAAAVRACRRSLR
jgi:hypothetical protein